MQPTRKTMVRLLWRVLVITAVGLAAWRYIDWREVGTRFTTVRPEWLLVLLLLATLDRFIMAAKWLQLLRALGHGATLRSTLSAYYQATFMQRFLPSALGGDALRTFIIMRRHGQGSAVVATLVVEKLVAMLASLVIAAAGVLLVLAQARDSELVLVLAAIPVLVLLSIAGIRLTLNRTLADWLMARAPSPRLTQALARVYASYRAFAATPRVLLANFLYCLVEQGLQVLLLLLCAIAISVEAPVATLVAAIAISQSLRKFAILLEGWVLGEFTNVVVCSLLGIAKAQALAFSLLGHAVNIVASLPGLLLFVASTATLKDLRDARAAAA